MHAAVVEGPGLSPRYGEFTEPVAGPNETTVAVTASALSPLARSRASGSHYSSDGHFPFVPGVDGVGRLADGRRVYFLLPRGPFGGMAERTVVENGRWFELPAEIDDCRAAVIANPGMSSWAALTERARIIAGETVLINGATGASGQLAVRIARHLGAAKVIATGRNSAVLDGLGADATVLLGGEAGERDDAFAEHFEHGIDIVLDYLWGESARHILIAGAKAGPAGRPIRFVQIGSMAGSEIALPSAVLRSSSIELKGSGLGSVGLDRLLAAIKGVIDAAIEISLDLHFDVVALNEVEPAWTDPNPSRRIVFAIS